MTKRLFAMMLVLVMVLSMLPTGVWAEGAGTPAPQTEQTTAEEHTLYTVQASHDHVANDAHICEHCVAAGKTGDDAKPTWIAWGDDEAEKKSLPTASNHYYIVGDLNKMATSDLSSGSNKDVVICLNGKSLNCDDAYSASNRFYTLGSTNKLTVLDCTAHVDADGKYVAGSFNNATYTTIMFKYEKGNATFTMYDGIVNNSTQRGANGGAVKAGGAILVQGPSRVNLYGGEIRNARASSGGAIRLYSKGAVLDIDGAAITGCSVNSIGSAIVASENSDKAGSNPTRITIKNATITGNTSAAAGDDCGGAIYVAGNTAVVTLSGNNQITGNTDKDGAEYNLFLHNDTASQPKYTVSGLSATAMMGIRVHTDRLTAEGGLVLSTALNETVAGRFVANNEGYVVKTVDGVLTLVKESPHAHKVCNDDTACPDCAHTDVTYQPWGNNPGEDTSLPTTGDYYLTTDVTLSKQVDLDATNLNLCLNGHTIKTASGVSVRHFMLSNNAQLVISNCDKNNDGILTGGKASSIMNKDVVNDAPSVELYNVVLKGNSYANGGAIMLQRNATLKAVSCRFVENTGTSSAGAIRFYGAGTQMLVNCQFTGNSAPTMAAIRQDNGHVTLIDTVITDNHSTNKAGDASYGAYYLVNTNGRTLTVAGATRITGNTDKDGKDVNLFFQNTVGNQGRLTIGQGGLTDGALIGITLQFARLNAADGLVVTTTLNGANPVQYLNSDNADYVPVLKNDVVVLEKPVVEQPHVHTICKGLATCENCAHEAETYQKLEGVTKLPTTSGNYYLTGDLILDTQASLDAENLDIKICMNGYSIKAQDGSSIRFLQINKKNIKVTISNCGEKDDTHGCITGAKNTAVMFNNSTAENAQLSLYNVNVCANSGTGSNAGAIQMQKNASLLAIGCDFKNNTAGTNGGAIRHYSTGTLELIGCNFTGNRAKYGYALRADMGTVKLTDTVIEDNYALDSSLVSGAVQISPEGSAAITFTVQGLTKITGNSNKTTATGTGDARDLYLKKATKQTKVAIGENGLTTGSLIGVFMAEDRLNSDNFVTGTLNGANPTAFFQSNVPGYVIVLDDDKLYMDDRNDYGHNHKACNDDACTDHGELVFKPWNGDSALPTAAGNYYLTKDVQLTAVAAISKDINICLNGYNITAKANERIFAVDGNLSIIDCEGSGKAGMLTGGKRTFGGGAASINAGATMNLFGGVVTNNQAVVNDKDNALGGAFFLYAASGDKPAAVFNMYGGKITGNSSEHEGGAIYARAGAQINLYGGEITNNTSGKQGGAIYLNGAKLIAENVIISGNSASSAGAIHLASNAQAELTGCQIKDNTVTGIVSAIRMESTGATLKLVDTVIEGNKSTGKSGQDSYGAVYAPNNAYSIIVEGATKITGNTDKDGNAANVFFQNAAGKQAVITIGENGLTEGALIGIGMQNARISNHGHVISANETAANTEKFFAADSKDYEIIRDAQDGKLYLKDKNHEDHNICADAACADNHEELVWLPWNNATALPASGNYYLNTDVTLKSVRVLNTADLNLCLNGHTITAPKNERTFALSAGFTLSVTDCGDEGTITGGVRNFGGVINVNQGATFNLYGGNLVGNQSADTEKDGKAGAIYLTLAKTGYKVGDEVLTDKPAEGVAYEEVTIPGGIFNMYGGTISGNKAFHGGAVFVDSGATVNIYGGEISGNEANRGGAIYVNSKAIANIAGGKITANTATGRGAAIFATGGEVNVSGGEISGHTAKTALVITSKAILNVSGGKITGNKGVSGGAVILESAGTKMTMSGGEISGNSASYGAGVYASTNTIFEMTGGVISGNTSYNTGGGLHLLRSNATLAGGEIKNNTASTLGGGVEVEGATVTMTGTKITGNTAKTGAGMYIASNKSGDVTYKPSVTLAGGEISGNTASSVGGGVTTKDTNVEKLELSGDLIIQKNTAGNKFSNLYLPTTAVFTVGQMGENAKVGISAARVYGAMSAETAVDCTAAFTSDNSALAVVYKDKTVYLQPVDGHAHCLCNDKSTFCEDHGTTVFAPWDDATKLPTTPGNYYLNVDVQLKAVCSLSEDVNLCLNGHTITAPKNERTFVLRSGVELSVTDCTDKGMITGGVRNFGGVINVNQGATFNLYGGNLTGNTNVKLTNENGKAGAVYLTKATIGYKVGDEILTEKPEAGVAYEEVTVTPGGVFNMYGGSITENVSYLGGAIFVCDGATANIYGGTIANNEAKDRGGAIAGEGEGFINIYGGTLTGNYAGKGGALYVRNGMLINMVGGVITKNKTGATTHEEKTINKGSGAAAVSLTNASTMVMSGGEISYNEGKGAGGAMLMESKNTKFIMNGGKFIGNTSTSDGGAIYVSTNTVFEMNGGEITNNQAKNGGGIYFLRSTGNITGGKIEKNAVTTGAGGGIGMARATVTMKGGSVSYNVNKKDKSPKAGGIQMNGSTFNLYGGSIVGNYSEAKGSGMAITTSTASETKDGVKTTFYTNINMYGGTIANHEGSYGGAILLQSQTVFNMYGGTIRNNHARSEGGAACLYSKSTFNMYGGTIANNTSDDRGGGLKFNAGTTGTFTGGTATGNDAAKYGGFFNAHGIDAKITMKNMKVYGNECRNYGGGIAMTWNAVLDMDDCEFYDNIGGEGGAMYLAHKTTCCLDNVKVYDNYSNDAGGAFFLDVGNNINFTNVEITNNESVANGGAIYTRANLHLKDCLIDGNVSGKDGGAIATSGAWTYGNLPENTNGYVGRGQGMIIENTTISNNTCVGRGGAAFMAKKNWNTIIDSTFTGNVSGESGSALFVGDDLVVKGMTVTGNTSKSDGYAVYYRENSYDNQSYQQAVHALGGNVIVKDNQGGDMFLCEKVNLGNTAEGYGENTHVNVAISDGVLTNRIIGEYNYEKTGDLTYVMTYGSRSYTEPEVDTARVAANNAAEEAENGDTLLYIGLATFVAVIVAAVVLVLLKKKKAGKAVETTQE